MNRNEFNLRMLSLKDSKRFVREGLANRDNAREFGHDRLEVIKTNKQELRL